MANQTYKKQVQLLLQVLPEVAKEACFALHGGTAINLFIRDMPRLSVDIDLTYVLIEDRETSFQNIRDALGRVKARVETVLPSARVIQRDDILKLQIAHEGAQIKLEVNQIGRGTLAEPIVAPLCDAAQEAFDAFCSVPLVPLGQIYGGKICAALDRQHPRDLFDARYLLDNEGFSEEVKTGFLLCLLSSDRPMHEVIAPNLLDQRSAMTNQFEGMSAEPFTYARYEETRAQLIRAVNDGLSEADRAFLLSVKAVEPDWSIYDFERFPAV